MSVNYRSGWDGCGVLSQRARNASERSCKTIMLFLSRVLTFQEVKLEPHIQPMSPKTRPLPLPLPPGARMPMLTPKHGFFSTALGTSCDAVCRARHALLC